MRAAIAVTAAVLGVAAATNPFFDADGRFKAHSDILTDCAPQSAPTSAPCPYTEVSEPIVCSPVAAYCQEYGRLPDTLSLSVCLVNFWLHNFLLCWGPYGALTPLVAYGCVPNVATEMNRLTTLFEDANNTFTTNTATVGAPFSAPAYLQCVTPADIAANYPEYHLAELRDTALAALRLNQSIGILGKLAANISHVQPTTPPIHSETLFTNVRFRCGGENNTLMWRPNPAVPTLPADETHIAEVDTLTLCATVARYELTQHLDIRDSPASDLDEVGCFLTDADDYVPYYRNRTAATAAPSANDAAVCFSGDGNGPGAGFSCVAASVAVGTADVTTYSFSHLRGSSGHPAAAATGVDPADLVAFSCSFPYFPRGEVETRACSTTYAQAETVLADGAVLVATAANIAASPTGCADLCTTAGPLCIGYTVEPLVPYTCGLVFPATATSKEVGELSARFRLKIGYADSGSVPTGVRLEAVPGRLSYTKKTMTRSGNTAASLRDGPWLVYGYADRANLLDQTRFLVDAVSRPTPEGCGALCSQIENCVFSVWSDRVQPCRHYVLDELGSGTATFPPDFLFDGPPRCDELEINRLDPDAAIGASLNNTVRRVCGAAPRCTVVDGARTACANLAVSSTADYTVAPASLPVVYAVPDPAARLLTGGSIQSSWCSTAEICTACSGPTATAVCAGAETIVVPATVSEFDGTAFSGCGALREAVLMTPTPHLRPGAFSGCPLLERILFENHECHQTRAGTGCSVVVDPGAVPSCVGPSATQFGYSTAALPTVPIPCGNCDACGVQKSSFFGEMPATGSGYGPGAFAACRLLHGYTFSSEPAVVVVQTEAFMDAVDLAVVDFGNFTREIGDRAFKGTTSLNKLIGGLGLTSIGSEAFFQSSLSGVFPLLNSLAFLGARAFYGSRITTFHTGPVLTEIGAGAFEASALRVVSLGAAVSGIGTDAFRSCRQLETVEIQSTVLTEIGPGAFIDCIRLTAFELPGSGALSILGPSAFVNTPRLRTFDLRPVDATALRAAFGAGSACTRDRAFEFEAGFKYIDCVPVVVPATCAVTSPFTGPGLPAECAGVSDVIVNTTFIPQCAFADGMGTIRKVTIGNTVTTIDTGAFGFVDTGESHNYYHDSAIEEVVFEPGRDPADTLVIQTHAFARSVALKRLNISGLYPTTPTAVQIMESAFAGSGATSADLGDVTFIGLRAFKGALQLSEVIFGSGLQTIAEGAFSNCVSLSMVSIPASVVVIGAWAFSGCTRLSAVEFNAPRPNSFTVFESFVFDQAAEITTVKFQSGQLKLGPSGSSTLIDTSHIFAVSSVSPYGVCTLSDGAFCDASNFVQFLCFGVIIDPTVAFSCPTFPTAPQVSAHATPAHAAPAAAATFTGFDYRASLECVPCAPSDTAAEAHRAGRAVVPASIRHVSAGVLAECPGVTAVTVPATTTFVSEVGTSAFASPVLKQLTFDPPVAAGSMPTHHSYTARCLMNVDTWFSQGTTPSFPHNGDPEDAVGSGYGTLGAFAGAPVVPNGVECVPCATDASVGDLTVPWYVRHIPPYAFSDCSIPGTVRFGYHGSSSFYGVQQIAPHGFHMEVGNSLGAVVVPPSIRDETHSRGSNFGGLGYQAFSAIGFGSFIVVVPDTVLIKTGSPDGFPNQDRSWWRDRVNVRTGPTPADSCYRTGYSPRITPEAAPPTGTVTASGCLRPENITAELAKPPRKLARLFGVCDCDEMRPGCFPDEEYNPVATLPDARAAECGPETRRIGPVTIPYYPLLLPPGVVPITINQSASAYDPTESETCTLEFLVRVPPGAHRPGCDLCDASQCVPAAMDSVAAADFVPPVAAPVAAPAPGPAPPPPEDPAPPDTNTATVVAIVIVSVLGGTWAVWYAVQAWRRRAGAGKDGRNRFK
jgi:hypothetical protein